MEPLRSPKRNPEPGEFPIFLPAPWPTQSALRRFNLPCLLTITKSCNSTATIFGWQVGAVLGKLDISNSP
jgi:hypothetical protein